MTQLRYIKVLLLIYPFIGDRVEAKLFQTHAKIEKMRNDFICAKINLHAMIICVVIHAGINRYLYKMLGKSNLKWFAAGILACGLLVNSGYITQDSKVVQIKIGELLNARPVTTLTKYKLVHWGKGVDHENGYLTTSAAKFIGEKNPKALPDNPLIPATDKHPAILLHYDNKDAYSNQAMALSDTNEFTIKVPKNKYKDLFICLTSAYGKSKLEYDLIYSDGSIEEKNITVPDWANDVPQNDPDFSYVVHDLAKWSNTAKQTEPNHHNIHALNIHPDATRTLTAVKVKNNSKTYLLLWAATGVLI